jgi:hypothetical protein
MVRSTDGTLGAPATRAAQRHRAGGRQRCARRDAKAGQRPRSDLVVQIARCGSDLCRSCRGQMHMQNAAHRQFDVDGPRDRNAREASARSSEQRFRIDRSARTRRRRRLTPGRISGCTGQSRSLRRGGPHGPLGGVGLLRGQQVPVQAICTGVPGSWVRPMV